MSRLKHLTAWIAGFKVWLTTAIAVIALGVAISAAGWRPVLKSEFDTRFAGLSKDLESARCSRIRILLAVNRSARRNSRREKRQASAVASRVPPALAPKIPPALIQEIEDLDQERYELLRDKVKFCLRARS